MSGYSNVLAIGPTAKLIGTRLNLVLIGAIGDFDDFGKAIRADQVIAALGQHPSATEINVVLDLVGGDIREAVVIYEALRRHPARVAVTAGAVCDGAALVVMMAGDERRAFSFTTFTLKAATATDEARHDQGERTAEQFRQTAARMIALAEALVAIDRKTVTILVERSGAPACIIERAMAAGETLSAHDAAILGFCSAIDNEVMAVFSNGRRCGA